VAVKRWHQTSAPPLTGKICQDREITNGTGIDSVRTIQIPWLKERPDLSIFDGDFFKRGIGGGCLLPEFNKGSSVVYLAYREAQNDRLLVCCLLFGVAQNDSVLMV
jgi:hypothetical protein